MLILFLYTLGDNDADAEDDAKKQQQQQRQLRRLHERSGSHGRHNGSGDYVPSWTSGTGAETGQLPSSVCNGTQSLCARPNHNISPAAAATTEQQRPHAQR